MTNGTANNAAIWAGAVVASLCFLYLFFPFVLLIPVQRLAAKGIMPERTFDIIVGPLQELESRSSAYREFLHDESAWVGSWQ